MNNILLRGKYVFNVTGIENKKDFHNGKYDNVFYLTGSCESLGMLRRTIVMSKTEYNNKKI